MEIGELVCLLLGGDAKIPVLVCSLIELVFKNPIVTSLERKVVDAPHWSLGDVNPGNISKKPVAYVMGAADVTAEVKINVMFSENVSGNAKLEGSLGALSFEGECPTSVGEHTVQVKIGKLPDDLAWIYGDVVWGLDVPSIGRSIRLNPTRIELFTLLAEPEAPFAKDPLGVPVEALRWVFSHGFVTGLKKPEELVSAVTRACHRRPGTKYDTKQGASKFIPASNLFHLLKYVSDAPSAANCYDQAGAVYLLCRAFGAPVDMVFLGYGALSPRENFGYINTTALIGVPFCNNPFYENPLPIYRDAANKVIIRVHPKPLAPKNYKTLADVIAEGARTSFGNHAFCSFTGNIYDACAGPVTGLSRSDYVIQAIDASTNYYTLWGQKPGRASDIDLVEKKSPGLLPKAWQ
jgi:hypothetical protein